MAKNIFNENYGVDTPTLLLQNRNFETIGSINNVFGFTYKENYNSANELSFSIYKKIDGYENYLWDSIIDFKIIYIPEFKERFEINTSVISNDSTVKSVTATSLCESELSQTMLYDIEINTENDILNADYDENFPTIFYRDPESFHNYDWSDDKYKDYTDDKKREILRHSSLLHRILEKAEHYSIGTVANSLKSLNIIREFSISDTDIYSVLTGEIADEFNCIFLFDSMTRTLSAYDLYNTCTNCNYRGDFSDKCPECGSKEFGGQYGKDTTVFISNENLAQEISLETNKDSLKNCFYVEGGDNIITSTIRSINPNGTNYIYEYNDDTKEDMPEELSSTIDAYDKLYQEYFTQKVFPLDPTSVENYNKVVQEINQLFKEDDSIGFSKIGQNLIGYSSVIESIYEATDLYQFLQNSMMPTINIDGLGLEESLQNIITGFSEGFSVINDNGSITTYFQNQISLMDYTTATQSSVENAIKKSAHLYYSRAYYDLDINTLSYERATDSKNGTWKGTFTLTSLTETNDNGVKLSETSDIVTLEINNNIELYIEQSIYRAVTDIEKSKYGEITSLKMDFDTFKEKISLYSFSELERLKESFQACLNIIIAANIFDEELKKKYYDFYKERFDYIDIKELPKREEQLKSIQALYSLDSSTYETSGILYDIKKEVNRILNFKEYLISNPLNYDSYNGEQLWKTFCAYRREDKYTNSNYISDGLTNAKIIENTKQLFDTAKKELYKASHLQLTLSANLNNLLVLEEFQPLVNSFSCGNWIRVGIDEKIYKLRLLSYQINFDDIPSIEVEFSTVEKLWSGDSDVKSILDSAKSMASSYSYTVQQVNNSSKSSKYVENWVEKGLDATATKLVNSANNQDIVIDRNGILCRKYDDINDIYDLCQTKIISNGIYTTDNGWETVSTGIGKICYIDPETGKEVIDYGLIAKTVIGKLFLGEQLKIYGANNSVILDENGITLDGGAITWKTKIPQNSIDGLDDFQTSVNTNLSTLNSAIPVTKIGDDYVISPKIGGGYLYISNVSTGISAEINPKNIIFDGHNNNYVFSISKNNIQIMGVNSNGEGYFNGKITAGSGSKIGGFDIDDNSIYNGTFGTSDSVMISTGSTSAKSIAGSKMIRGWAFTAGDKFGVTNTGKMYATDLNTIGGKIGGFTIGEFSIYSDYHTQKDESCSRIIISSDGTIVSKGYFGSSEYDNLNKFELNCGRTIFSLDGVNLLESTTGEVHIDSGGISCFYKSGTSWLNIFNNGTTFHVLGKSELYGNIEIIEAIDSHMNTGTYLNGNRGNTIINSEAGAGNYVMLDKLNSTNGYFTDGIYQDKRVFHYTAKSVVNAGTNSYTSRIILLDESGNTSLNGLTVGKNLNISGKYLYFPAFGDNINMYPAIYNDTYYGKIYFGSGSKDGNGEGASIETFVRGMSVYLYNTASNGGVYLGASGSTAVTSDENFKILTNIDERYENFFYSLKPTLYTYKTGHRKHIGLGARAVEKALKDSELENEDFAGLVIQKDVNLPEEMNLDIDGNTHFDELYHLRYEEFISLNTYMIQKSLCKIDKLEKENEKLKEQIVIIKEKINNILNKSEVIE